MIEPPTQHAGNAINMAEQTLKPGWTRVAFGDVVKLNTDRCAGPAAAGIERYVGLEHIEPEDLRIRRWGLVEEGTTFTNRFRPGQVLFGKRRAYQRKVAVADFEGVCSSDIYVFEPKDERLLPELLPFLCQTEAFYSHAVGTSAGSLSPRTNWTQLATYEFALPPLEEQQRQIRVFESCKTLRDSYSDFSVLGRTLLESLQKKYFLVSPEGKLRKVGDVADVRNGTTPSRTRSEYWNGIIPWLPTGKVNERFISRPDEYITEQALAECSIIIIPKGSILVAMIGQGQTRGKAARLEIDACINQNFAAVVPGDEIDPWFLFYQLDANYEHLRAWSQGTNQHALNCALVSDFRIQVPDVERQMAIADELRSVELAVQNAEHRQKSLSNIFEIMRETFLSES